MTSTFKSRFRKTLGWLAAGFVLFFVFRLTHEYWAAPFETEMEIGLANYADSGEQSLKRNYATHQVMKGAATFQDAPAGKSQTQKYEQMATVRTQAIHLLFLFCMILGLVAAWLLLTVADKWGVLTKFNQP